MLYQLPPWGQMSNVPVGSTAMAALQSTVMDVLYPSGIPTSGADANVDGIGMLTNVPVGTDTCRRYTHLQNGGFEAGGSPIYTWMLAPANPVGKIVAFYGGHTSYDAAGAYDLCVDEMRPIEGALGAGLHVLVVEPPQIGYNPNPGSVVLNGETVGILNHWLAQFDALVAPNAMRLFIDYAIRGLTQALADVPGLECVGVISFSGGGFCSTVWQIVDPRILTRYTISGFWPKCLVGWLPANTDWEFQYAPLLRTAVGGDTDILEPLSAYGGRRVVEYLLEHDGVMPFQGRHALVDQLFDRYAVQLYDCVGSSVEHVYDYVATNHNITQETSDAVIADIVAHL